MRLGVVASQPQYMDHAAPVWLGAEPGERGSFLTHPKAWEQARQRGLHLPEPAGEPDLWLSAAESDLRLTHQFRRTRGHPQAFMEHGVGLQWYRTNQLVTIGKLAGTILAPNDFIARRWRAALPGKPVHVVGTPKMDALLAARAPEPGVVAFSFHWTTSLRGQPTPASLYLPVARQLAAEGLTVLGHAHPRVWERVEPLWRRAGIEPVERFEEVARRASLYMCDGGSTPYEMAALGCPVVLLRVPGQQKMISVSTGLRYDRHENVGPKGTPMNLADVARLMLEQPETNAEERARATEELYPHLGGSVDRALEVLRAAR